MDEQEELRRKVAQQIREAFADTPYPGDTNLAEFGSRGNDDEPRNTVEIFRGHHWRTITSEIVISNYACLSYSTPEAFYAFYTL